MAVMGGTWSAAAVRSFHGHPLFPHTIRTYCISHRTTTPYREWSLTDSASSRCGRGEGCSMNV
eukprot:353088-Chlamydomonas_euryale.AAC.14